MSVQRISTLARERWNDGAHARKHLRVHPDVMEWMRLLAPERRAEGIITEPLGFSGISVVVEPDLSPGSWRLCADAPPHEVVEWGILGHLDCEHAANVADVTTFADTEVRFHRYCVCGAHWFDIAPHITYEPVHEPAP